MPSGPRIRANNVYGLISDNPLAVGATTFNSSGLVTLPDVTAAHAVVVLDPKRIFGEPEIVIVTAHASLTTFATITRAQYGTVARAHPANTSWAHVPINEDFVVICTTLTHPSNPYVGQLIFETDLLAYKSWNGVAWVDVGSGAAIYQNASPPPGPAAGTLWLDTDEGASTGLSSIIGYSASTATQSGIGAETDITGTVVTITVPAGRRIRVVGRIEVGSPSVNLNAFLLIKEGGTEIGRAAAVVNTATESTLTAETIISPTAGSHTYKLTLQTNTGTINTSNIASAPNYILVEDITGTLWPAGTTIGAATIASEAWIDWVPSFTNFTLGNGVLTAKYYKTGRTVRWYMKVVLGTTSSMGSSPTFSLPFTMSSLYSNAFLDFLGYGWIQDSGTAHFGGFVNWATTTTVSLNVWSASGAFIQASGVTGTNPMTWTTSDSFTFTGTYEAVS